MYEVWYENRIVYISISYWKAWDVVITYKTGSADLKFMDYSPEEYTAMQNE